MDTIWEWLLPLVLPLSPPTTSSLRIHRVNKAWHRLSLSDSTIRSCVVSWLSLEPNQLLFGKHPRSYLSALGLSTWKEAAILCFGTDRAMAAVFRGVPFSIPHRDFVGLCREILGDLSMRTTFDLDALAILQEHTEFVVERAIRLSLDDSKEAGVSWQKMMTEVGGLSRLWDPVDEAMDDDNDEDYDPELEQESLLGGEDMDCTDDDECIESEVYDSNSDSEFEDDIADWVTSEDTPEYSPLNASFRQREGEIQIFTDMAHYEDPERSGHSDTQVHYLAQLHSETSIVDRCMPLNSAMEDETIEQLHACIRQYSSLQNALGTTPIHLVNRAKHLFRECNLYDIADGCADLCQSVKASFAVEQETGLQKDPYGEETNDLLYEDFF